MSRLQRYVQALDLQDDEQLMAEYRRLHQRIWPEIASHLRQNGIVGMDIYQLGNRLVMVMETDDRFSAERLAAASQLNPKVVEWEALMWRYQIATPWTPPGEKWVAMEPVFSLSQQP